MSAPLPLEISPADVASRLATGQPIRLIDVREVPEYRLARLSGSELIPMGSIPAELQKLESLASENTLVVYCHHGVRSLQVVHWLREQGVDDCTSLAGGIDRWSREMDQSVPRY